MRGLRTKRVRAVKEGTLIATVDIGATTNTGYCTCADGRDIKVFKFGNTREGFEKFWHMVVSAQNRFTSTEVVVGYESTGPYAEPLVHYLMIFDRKVDVSSRDLGEQFLETSQFEDSFRCLLAGQAASEYSPEITEFVDQFVLSPDHRSS